jgi:hypothetical protein
MKDAKTGDRHVDAEINHYDYSGIDERHGIVPAWLLCVCVALVIWSVYYVFHFWRAPGIGGFGG